MFPANYSQNNIILASDINGAIGNINSLNPYPSAAAANLRVAALWGVGFGNYGYGQTSPVLSPVSAGNIIQSTEWTNLRNALFTMLQHYYGTSTPTTSLPPASALSVGSIITAHSGSNPFNFNSEITLINTNRTTFFNTTARLNSTTLTSNAHTVTRTTSWGVSPYSTGIQSEIDVIFPTENQARYFFNTGGEILINFTQSNTSNSKSANWNNVFNTRIGVFSFAANSCSWTGTYPGSPISIGYYNLTTSYVTYFNGNNIGTGVYSMNDLFIDVRYSAGTTVNGARGTTIRFRFRLLDEHVLPYPYEQSVLPNTSVVFSHRRATTFLSGIVSPTYNTFSGWINI